MADAHGLGVDEWRRTHGGTANGVRQELLDGEPVYLAAPTAGHSSCVNRINAVLVPAVAGRAVVSVQNPLMLDERSEPRPDIALLSAGSGGVATIDDVLLLIEVADTPFEITYDRGRKASYYARSGVPECWIVDLASSQVLVHRSPASSGYCDIRNLRAGASLAVPTIDGLAVDVDAFLS